MFNKSVDSVVKSLTKIINDLKIVGQEAGERAADFASKSTAASDEQKRANRILDNFQGLLN